MTEPTRAKRYFFAEIEKALRDYGAAIHYTDLAELMGRDALSVGNSLAHHVAREKRGHVKRVGRGTYEYVQNTTRGRAPVAVQPELPPLDDAHYPEHTEPEDTPLELTGRAKQMATNRIARIERMMRALIAEFADLDAELRANKIKADKWDKLQGMMK